ncbi:MAG: ABC transporter permease [Bacteroidales bacterium]|jgi:ABC-2 type transport system permease protein|nr:ABC transporter permease [Bacteroidales bacterium]
MKNNTLVVLQREYFTRVKKKSFIITTLLMPLLMVVLMFAPALLMNVGKDAKTFIVVDSTGLYSQAFVSDVKNSYVFMQDTASARDSLKSGNYTAALVLLPRNDTSNIQNVQMYYAESEPSLEVTGDIKNRVKTQLQSVLMQQIEGIDEKVFEKINRASVEFSSQDVQTGVQSYVEVKTVFGFVCGFLIYFFVFIFGSQIMSGVLEEKQNRIVEVIVSSVKPMQLMLGKVFGLALVGFTQILIWVVFGFLLITVGGLIAGSGVNLQDIASNGAMGGMTGGAMGGVDVSAMTEMMNNIQNMIASINIPYLVLMFLFYFLGGYFLYASLFAAVGAAVETQEETSQFMLPITVPLILALIVTSNIIMDPNGPIAFWFSMIPFTSPIAMMVRLPFGVPVWEVALSLGLLVLGFLFTTWLASRIYRVGILMYGKKITWRELWKWVRY